MGARRGTLAGLLLAAIAIAAATAAAQPSSECAIPEIGTLLDRAASRLRAADDREAAALLSARPAGGCADLALAQLAVTGWVEARALAAKGGDPALLAPVNTVLRAIEALRRASSTHPAASPARAARSFGLQIDYAEAAVRAAVDASQDERGEMSVYLDHARDLASVLEAVGDPPQWPLPYDEVEGELWFEVDRYAEARTAYARAIANAATARALIGLARASDRLDDRPAACENYRRALTMELAPAAKSAAVEFVAACK